MLNLPIGPPGCGKSHLAQQMIQAGLLVQSAIVSPDSFRLQITDAIEDQTANRAVFSIVDQIVEERLRRGLDVYVDATNLQISNIKTYIAMAQRHDQGTRLIVSEASNELCSQRNETRDRIVPRRAMEMMFKRRQSLDLSVVKLWDGVETTTIEALSEKASDIIFNQKYDLPSPFDVGSEHPVNEAYETPSQRPNGPLAGLFATTLPETESGAQ